MEGARRAIGPASVWARGMVPIMLQGRNLVVLVVVVLPGWHMAPGGMKGEYLLDESSTLTLYEPYFEMVKKVDLPATNCKE